MDNRDEHEANISAMHEAGRRLAKDKEFHDHFWPAAAERVGRAIGDWFTRWIGRKLLAVLVGGGFGAVIWFAVVKGWIRP
jgi:hypothetical protein